MSVKASRSGYINNICMSCDFARSRVSPFYKAACRNSFSLQSLLVLHKSISSVDHINRFTSLITCLDFKLCESQWYTEW